MTRLSDLRQRLERFGPLGDSVEHVDALNDLSEDLLFANGPQGMFESSEAAVAMARRLEYARGEAIALFHQGTANWLVSRLELSFATLLEADAIFREIDDASGRAKVRFTIGAVYRSLGDYDQAFLDGLQSVEYFEANPDPAWESRSRLSLAMTFFELGDFAAARTHYERVLALQERSDEQWIVGRALTGIGATHDAEGDHRTALTYQLRALKTCEAVQFRMGEARALHEIGHSYERLGDRKKAYEYYSKSLRLREEIDQREAQCTSLIALGKLSIESDSEAALVFLYRALEIAEKIGAKPRVFQAHLALSQAHEMRGDVTKALAHYKAYHSAHDEVAKLTSGMRVNNLQTVFDAERKKREAEITRLKESLEEGTSLGSYRLIERLGEGGMGEVWRGEHRLLARPAAIKVIRALAADDAGGEQLVQRFRREAEVTSSLRSPHTVQLFDFGVSDSGQFHYVMELLDGMDTRQMVERFGPLRPERLVFLLRQACRALAEAHEKGLIHRDIKPANLFVAALGGEYDFLKVLDFGMVKTGLEQEDLQITAAGNLLCTPAYVAPEWVTGEGTTDGRADLYSLGCTAYWLLTGTTVFQAKSPTAMLLAHVNSEPPPLSQVSEHPIPDALERILRQCLEKRAQARPASAIELWDRLGQVDCGAVWDGDRAREWWLAHVPDGGFRGAATRRAGASPRGGATGPSRG